MKTKFLIAILVASFAFTLKAQTILEPTVKTPTSFAIVIDSVSFAKTSEAVQSYKKVIESDNLGTYIIIDDWQSPDDIKTVLLKLYNNKKSPLEGVVLVGDIPIPMLRDAQHMTSAFKMDQGRYAWSRSSVPSDRFYDDFDLKFDFLKQDEENPDYFYYSLRHDGAQKLNSDIYSARVKPYDNEKGDKYTHLKKYLEKVVKERTSNKNNVLNELSMGRGHGYNSESKVAWSGQQLALKEQFPVAFSTKGKVKFMDFDSRWPIKEYYMDEVQQPNLDVMLFNHHGGKDMQYLNGYKSGSDHNTSIENIKIYARSKIRSAARNKSKEEAMKQYIDFLNIPPSWVEDTFDSVSIAKDSIFNLTLDININDIRAMSPQARFVMFNACYNGSFHYHENVAGEYIFNDGKTLVTQGNTVNVIQDKWPDEFLGLLAAGMRVGTWGKYVNYLETHIIGDPTFRFANNTNIDFDINLVTHTKKGDNKFWLKQLDNENVDLQAFALRKLYENNYSDISNLLKKTYTESNSMITRAESFFLLSRLDDENFIDVLSMAATDSYELIRRFAVEFIAKNGADRLIPAYLENFFWDTTSERILYRQRTYLQLLNLDKLKDQVLANQKDYNNPEKVDELLSSIDRSSESFSKYMEVIMSNDTAVKSKDKIFDLRRLRNHPDNKAIDQVLELVNDSSADEEVRLVAIEALGWYNYSHRRDDIIEGLKPLITDENIKVREEAIKTINRL